MEELGSSWKHKEAPRSREKHREALGSSLEVMGSTRKHLAVLGRNLKEGNHWEALGSTRKHLEGLGSTWKHYEALKSAGKYLEALRSTWKN